MYSLFWTGELWCMNVLGYLKEILLLFKELLYNFSILDLCSTLTFCTWCVLMFCYNILSIWIITHYPYNQILIGFISYNHSLQFILIPNIREIKWSPILNQPQWIMIGYVFNPPLWSQNLSLDCCYHWVNCWVEETIYKGNLQTNFKTKN